MQAPPPKAVFFKYNWIYKYNASKSVQLGDLVLCSKTWQHILLLAPIRQILLSLLYKVLRQFLLTEYQKLPAYFNRLSYSVFLKPNSIPAQMSTFQRDLTLGNSWLVDVMNVGFKCQRTELGAKVTIIAE